MKQSIKKALVLTAFALCVSSSAIAAECSGSWRVLPNYSGVSGGPCAAIGLNTHQATCQPGQRYATYCDDASGGRYRTCQSSVPCSPGRDRDYGHGGFRDNSRHSGNDHWDYRDDRRENRDDRRDDRRDYRDDRRDDRRDYRDDRRNDRWDYRDDRRNKYQVISRNCTQWDYKYNRPCAPGTINRDCRNGCDGRLY